MVAGKDCGAAEVFDGCWIFIGDAAANPLTFLHLSAFASFTARGYSQPLIFCASAARSSDPAVAARNDVSMVGHVMVRPWFRATPELCPSLIDG